MKKWGKALREKEMQIAIEQRKNPETVEISGFSGHRVYDGSESNTLKHIENTTFLRHDARVSQ